MAVTKPPLLTRISAALQVLRSNPQERRFGWLNMRDVLAGVKVDHDSASQVAAVWACMDVISSALSSSDWNVYQGIRDAGNQKVLTDDALQYVLNTRLNPEMTAQAGKRALMLAAVGWGNGYAEIQWDGAGRMVALWPISPDRVEPQRDTGTGELFYRVTQGYSGGFVDVAAEDMFHIRGASLVGFAGDDPVSRAIKSIAMALALDQFGASYFGNGTVLGGVIKSPSKLGDPEFDRLQTQWNSKHQGSAKAFKVGLLEGGLDFQPFEHDAEKAQMVEAKYVSVEEICRWFRVPPHKVAHLLRATNNNIEHQGLEFSRDTLRPWVKEIQQEADYKLISMRGPRKFVEIDVDWAEQGDYKSRAEAYQILRNIGVFSANDVLKKLGENTIGKEGDIRIVQGANVRLEDVGAAYASAPVKPSDGAPQAWLTSIYQRLAERRQNKGNNVGAYAYATERLQPFKDAMCASEQAAAHIDKGADRVIQGGDPATSAARVIAELKGTA